jgi:hypothetical protein
VVGHVSSYARAEVFQVDPERTPLPQPVGASELALGPAWGYVSESQSYFDPITGAALSTPITYGQYYSPPAFPQFVDGDAFTFDGLFKWRRESIDPIADATTAPGHFHPGCGFRAELVLQGGDCDVALGWYNFTGGDPPARADIQPLVPQGSTYLEPTWATLVPLAWDNRDPRNLSKRAWTPQVFSTGDISANPKYAGGNVAFVMLGHTGTQCNADKFSVYEHNPKNAAGVPWVTALIYRSVVDPSAIYLAFEDLPMPAADWRDNVGLYANDADFNDAVFYISGLGPESCPAAACRDVVCGADEICAEGACVPASGGSGGAPEGGAPSSSGGGDASESGASGASTSAQGGAADGTIAEIGGEAPGASGGATSSSGGAADYGDGSRGLSGDPGCSCRVSLLGRVRAVPLLLVLTLAVVLARRRGHSS